MAAWLYPLLVLFGMAAPPRAEPTPTTAPGLDRMALAVEGAESSFGTNKAMWRPNSSGPQGPMQVSAAAAADVGDGDRFDLADNRRLGRAYLALLYKRYGDWTDAVAAYYWGPGNVDRWVAAGHGPDALSLPIRAYVDRVMHGGTGPVSSVPTDVLLPHTAPVPRVVEITNPALRRKYLAIRTEMDEVHAYLDATQPADAGGDPKKIIGLIRRVSARPGFEEFALLRAAHGGATPPQAALRQIAEVLLDKLQTECAAIVIVDQRHGTPHKP